MAPAFDGVKNLGIILEDLERTDLLSDLAYFGSRLISQWHLDKLEYVTKNKIYIRHFTFADGILELVNLQEQFYYKIQGTSWAIWERLTAIQWCYKTRFSYWKNNGFAIPLASIEKNWQRLNLHGMWGETNQIKNHSKTDREFLSKKHIGKIFKLLIY